MNKSGVSAAVIVASAIMFPVIASANSCCGSSPAPAKKTTPPKKTEAAAAKTKVVVQTTCPVMEGRKIDKALYAEHDGKRIYVCCKGCISKIEKEPAKYIKKLEDAGVTLERVQTKCPVMGGKIDKSLFVEHDGKKIYVCCKACIPKVKADPAKYAKKVEEELKQSTPKTEKKKKKKDTQAGRHH